MNYWVVIEIFDEAVQYTPYSIVNSTVQLVWRKLYTSFTKSISGGKCGMPSCNWELLRQLYTQW